nr:hypothetical protein [Tanacetum cinerariifolium]
MIELCGTFQAWLQQQKDQVCQKILLCYDDDNSEESSTPFRDIIISELPSCIAITPILSTKDSLIMGDEHLDTIPEKESDEFIKSSVEDLVPNPSESEDEREYDVLIYDDFTTFSNILFDANDDFSSSDDESFYDEDIPKEIYSNPLFDEEIISIKIDPHHFNADDSLMEEIDVSLTPDDSMPPGIENDDYDSEGDILILEGLPCNDSLSFPETESFHFDIPSSPRPPAKSSDDDEIEPNLGILTVKVGLKAFQLSFKSPMMIYGENIPILDVPFLHFYPPSPALVWGDRVKLSDLKQALYGWHTMLILVVVMNKRVVIWRLAFSISRDFIFKLSLGQEKSRGR